MVRKSEEDIGISRAAHRYTFEQKIAFFAVVDERMYQ